MKYSVVKKLNLNDDIRFDADFYQRDYLNLDILLKECDSIKDLCDTFDLQSNGAFKDIFTIINDGNKKVVPYIRSGNVGNFFINHNDLKFISAEAHEKLTKTHTCINDIMMARKGKIGGATIITSDAVDFNSNDNVVNLKIKRNKKLNPYYLTTFLNCKYGLMQVERFATGNVQPWLSMHQVRNLKIISKNESFQMDIENLVNRADNYNKETKKLYKQSEELLLKELGLLNWQPKHKLYSIKKYSEVEQANRIDAEYFQPKYDEIIDKIKNYPNGFDKLNSIVDIKKNIEVGSEEYVEKGIPFVRVSNLTKMEINDNNLQYITEKRYNNLAKVYQPQKGDILLSKDGTAGIAFYIDEQPKNMILSGGILRLKIKNKDYLPEYLTLVLNSLIVQQQVERVSSGALIKHWLVDEVNATLIPKLDIDNQKEIVAKIKESSNCRKKSKQLLEIAKRGVEIAIEENEEIATDWINNEFIKIGIKL